MWTDVWDVYREELGVVPEDVVLALRDAVSRSSVEVFVSFGVGILRRVYFGPILKLEVLLKLAALPFLEEVCCGFVAGVWAELLVARTRAGYIVFAKMMRLISIALSILLTLLFLLFYSFAGASSPLLMFLRESGINGLLSLGGML